MLRAVLVALFAAASAGVAAAQQPDPVPPPRPATPKPELKADPVLNPPRVVPGGPAAMPPEPAAMGGTMSHGYPVFPAAAYYPPYSQYGYGMLPPRGPWGPSVAPIYVPSPFPGSAMRYPYPNSVSSYSYGPGLPAGVYPAGGYAMPVAPVYPAVWSYPGYPVRVR